MKITVDKDLCSGHARCYAVASELYDLDDDGYSAITELEVPADQEDAAVRGSLACPERAITITE